MIALPRKSARRIALAAALSLLAHVLALWLPEVSLPHDEPPLPPLAGKLEPLPQLAAKRHPKPKPKPAPQVNPEPAPVAETIANNEAASAVEAAPVVEPTPPPAEEPKPAHPLPKHARLTFLVYKGLDRFQIGTVKQELEISGEEYTLKATTQTVGIARMFKNYQLIQTSSGKADRHGLVPSIFEEDKLNDGAKEIIKATFDWPSQKILFSHGGSTDLPTGAQDMLSIFYNLSQLPLSGDTVQLIVSNGKKLERYNFEIAAGEEITTSLGKLQTVHLVKQHAKGEGGFEIWLGMEYRLLPVKYRLIEPSGEVSGEIEISDIRVADE